MIFTSFEFLIFFVVVLAVRASLRSHNADKWFLLVASYVFYMSWSIACGFLILATSLVDFYVGRALGKVNGSRGRKTLLLVSLVTNLGLLAYFKYTNFLLDVSWSGLELLGFQVSRVHYDIILPAGISFFVFQSLSYTIDVYRRHIEPSQSVRDFLLFVAFFPQLIAGPIVRAVDFLPQLACRVRPTLEEVESGMVQFLVGAIKKAVLSDQVARHVDLIFANPAGYDGFTLFQGLLGYAVQIYCDFSGYSDMAIGAARIMGFRFPENFKMPYSATNITEFWRRWHISLSTWLRDYLYIPLGGNRKGPTRTYVNLLVTMLLGGLWHGASWNFVLWGGLHGAALATHKLWTTWNPFQRLSGSAAFNVLWTLVSRVLTLGVVLFGWVFFRCPTWSAAIEYLQRLLLWTPEGIRLFSPYIVPAVAAVFVTHLFIHKDREWSHDLPLRPFPLRLAAYSCLMIVFVCLAATDVAPFIYFQF